MNDEELPIDHELASTYLDDGLESSERATASADPNVMATVESFARVRLALGEVSPVAEAVKNAALAAALAEFDSLHGAATAAAPVAPVTSLQSRRRTYRALTSVAAAVAILAIGVAAINGTRNDSKSGSAVERNTSAAGTIAASSADAPSLKAVTAAGAPAGTAALSASETVAAAATAGDATAGATLAAPPRIDTRAALVEYAASIERVVSPTPQAPTTAQSDSGFGSEPVACLTSHQLVLGGPISVNGIFAYAVRDTSNGSVHAIAASDCKLLL